MLIHTKLAIPSAPALGISRPRLLEQLDRGLRLGHRLLVASASTGYGKTTLLSEWARQDAAKFCWLSLDEGDNDPARF